MFPFLSRGEKRKREDEEHDEEQLERPTKRPSAREIIVIDDSEEEHAPLIGYGTPENPYTFGWWKTGAVIRKEDAGQTFEISDEETDEIEVVGEKSRVGPRTQSPVEDWAGFFNIFRGDRSAAPGEGSRGQRKGDVSKEVEVKELTREDGDDDDQSVIFEFEIVRPPGEAALPWMVSVKEEVTEDAVPDLTSSQDTEHSEVLRTPSPLPDILNPVAKVSNLEDDNTAPRASPPPGIPAVNDDTISAKRFQVTVPELPMDRPLNIVEKKRIFFSGVWMHQKAKLQQAIDRYLAHVEGDRDEKRCWLYKGPLLPSLTKRNMSVNIGVRHDRRMQYFTFNVGFISMLLKGLLTEEQKMGIINESWHCSHVCGNWTCLNPQHVTAEAGLINVNRNTCFRDRDGPCLHVPKCLKYLKKPVHELVADGLANEILEETAILDRIAS